MCGWIEHITGGTRQNAGLKTGSMGAAAARIAWIPGSASAAAVVKTLTARMHAQVFAQMEEEVRAVEAAGPFGLDNGL